MNLDFHYYATYLAARDAGYAHLEACTIAHAAQYVDESSREMVDRSLLPGLDNCTPTVESNGDIAFKMVHSFLPGSNDLKETKDIWSSFHFLPGNFHESDSIVKYTGNKTAHSSVYGEKDAEDFKRLCLPNSFLSEKMINDTCKLKDNPFFLFLLGIRMHVLADTWAHRYFAGLNSYWINDAPEDVAWSPDGNNVPFVTVKSPLDLTRNPYLAMPPAPSCQSYCYLGHGRMGHLPDAPFARYTYVPRWSDTSVTKDNPTDYLSAYSQMVKAMKCIRTGTEYVRNTYEVLDFRKTYMLLFAFTRANYNATSARAFIDTWQPVIQAAYPDVLLTTTEYAGMHASVLPPFNKNLWMNIAKKEPGNYKIGYYQFNKAAAYHLTFIKDTLLSSGIGESMSTT